MDMRAHADDVKRRIRRLKRLERSLRAENAALIWDRFFDLRGGPSGESAAGARYTLASLAAMSREAYREAVSAYLAAVYADLYSGQGGARGLYDPQALARLDLPIYADEDAVKRRFRELAKRYHPDMGGDAERFVEMMEAYRALNEG